jgi:hypothetical protein
VYVDKIEAVITKSEDGINAHFPVVNEPVVDTLPPLSGKLKDTSLTIVAHFKSKGFELVNQGS